MLHRYPGTTIARDGLPSCVTPSLPSTPTSQHHQRPPAGTNPDTTGHRLAKKAWGLVWGGATRVREYQPVVLSTTPDGLALGSDSPRAEQPGPGTLGLPAGQILTAHALLMPAFSLPHPPPQVYTAASLACGTLPYPQQPPGCCVTASAVYLQAPLHYRRRIT